MANGKKIESYVPARLDRLPWSSWHWLIVVSLGATWILDGLEVTLAGSLGGILTRHETLGLTDTEVGATATCYLAGAVIGALLFGYGTDRFGRKKLFFITVAVYLIGTALSAFSWNFASYAFFRALTGAGIGGEYAAIKWSADLYRILKRCRHMIPRQHGSRLERTRPGGKFGTQSSTNIDVDPFSVSS